MDQMEPKHQPLEGSRERDEALVNSVGDLVLTDPQAMRALADPFRLALLDRLQRDGPATDAELSSTMQATRSSIQEHLHKLERFGLITRCDVAADAEESRWCAVAKGIFFEIPTDPEGQAAARQLSNAMFLRSVDLPRRWVADVEPQLGLEWVRAAGLFNARVMVTPDELRSIQEGLERLLEPFTTRKSDDVPAAAARVRILSYFMPEAAADKELSPDHAPFDFGLLPGDAGEYIITSGAFKGQRGFFSRDASGAVVGVDLAGRLFNRVPTVSH